MKKQIALMVSAVALASVMPAYSATNSGTRAGSSANLSAAPATRTRQNVDYAKYETRSNTATYTKQDGKNIYYTQPSNRSEIYKQYASGNSQTVRTSRSETVRTELKRKYFLAHPFYQPLQGKFGSVTDLAYNTSSYDLTLNQTVATPNPPDPSNLYALTGVKGTWHANQFAIKEDLSYGITDRIALMGMLRYEVNENKFDWKSDSDDKQDDNGLNLFGLGAQFRIVDTADWIAELSAYFQHQKDVSNNYMAELKAGYKVARSTIYGLVRGQYLDIDGDAYGNGVEGDKATMFVAYNVDNKAFYIEGGLGVFSVLDEDWTLNVEGIFGHYDWHDQFSIKGEIGWQPNDWFALGLYARASLYDSANGMKRDLYWYEPAVGFNAGLTEIGKAKLENNQEMSVGLRAMFQF